MVNICFYATLFAYDCKVADNRIIVEYECINFNYEVKNDINYVPARSVLEKLGAKVMWDDSGFITIVYKAKTHTPDFFIIDNKAYINADFISQVLDYNITEYKEANILSISAANPPGLSRVLEVVPTYNGYNDEDLYWMSRIIHAEANGEPYEAKIAVGNVILNRMDAPQYPDTVKGVIFDRKSGVQFTPTANGSIYNTPSTDSYLAAVEVLEGKRNAESALFFLNPRYAKSSWVINNRTYAFTLSNHDFYY